METNPVIAIPSYDGSVDLKTITAVTLASENYTPNLITQRSSALGNCFNRLWAAALNARTQGMPITHFAMLHADIAPEEGWLDKMLAIMETTGADVLSAIVPIKSNDGLTSTALDTGTEWRVHRFTMKQVYKMEPTFTHPKLLLNTGLMLVDFRKPWIEKIHFTIRDGMVKENGVFRPVMMSEDWGFSRDAVRLGAKLFATREVKVEHVGRSVYTNSRPWGLMEVDTINGEARV